MRPILQLIRQPMRTLAGILLTAMAVAVLCVSLAQNLAASQTARELNRSFVSVALPSSLQTNGADAWVNKTIAENPDIFKAEYAHGLASAYIPQLVMDNYTQHLLITQNLTDNDTYMPDYPSYSGVMLEITLLSGFSDSTEYEMVELPDGSFYMAPINGGAIGIVERVIGQEPGYTDPTGYRVILEPDEDYCPEEELVVGQRYLVYCQEYNDMDWMLRSSLLESDRVSFWGEDVDLPAWNLTYLRAKVRSRRPHQGVNNYTTTDYLRLDPEEYYVESLRCCLGDLITFVDQDRFMTVRMVLREAEEGYPKPTMAALGDLTAEEFLASEQGALWQQTLEDIRVNYNTFPVIGVEDMAYVADLCRGVSRITMGRDFTEEELASGAKVCIISKEAAERSGLTVGDTLDARFYNYSYDYPYQKHIHDGDGAMNPTAYRYVEGITEWAGEAQGYTIVGLYEQDYECNYPDENFYAFTSNTIFAPKTSISSDMDYSGDAMFRTWVIDNEKLLELQMMSIAAGFDGVFNYYDNGYNVVAQSLESFEQAANRMLPLGLCMYAVIMLLFLFLFPGRQGKMVAMLDSMGTGFGRKTGFVMWSALGILLPGTILGTAVSLALWRQIAATLMDLMGTNVELSLDTMSLWAAAAVQVLAAMAVTALIAVPMAKGANLMKHR